VIPSANANVYTRPASGTAQMLNRREPFRSRPKLRNSIRASGYLAGFSLPEGPPSSSILPRMLIFPERKLHEWEACERASRFLL
jgi:hypothetical protein